jgi:hypothetical protein
MSNSANVGPGTMQVPGAPGAVAEAAFRCAIKECDNMKLSKAEKASVKGSDKPCARLGALKHKCVDDKMKADPPPGSMSEPSFDMGPPGVLPPPAPSLLMRSSGTEPCSNFWSGLASIYRKIGGRANYTVGRLRRPDFVIGNGSPPQTVLDAKFPCSQNVKRGAFSNRNVFPSANQTLGFTPGQDVAYESIAGDGGRAETVSPKDVRNDKC